MSNPGLERPTRKSKIHVNTSWPILHEDEEEEEVEEEQRPPPPTFEETLVQYRELLVEYDGCVPSDIVVPMIRQMGYWMRDQSDKIEERMRQAMRKVRVEMGYDWDFQIPNFERIDRIIDKVRELARDNKLRSYVTAAARPYLEAAARGNRKDALQAVDQVEAIFDSQEPIAFQTAIAEREEAAARGDRRYEWNQREAARKLMSDAFHGRS